MAALIRFSSGTKTVVTAGGKHFGNANGPLLKNLKMYTSNTREYISATYHKSYKVQVRR